MEPTHETEPQNAELPPIVTSANANEANNESVPQAASPEVQQPGGQPAVQTQAGPAQPGQQPVPDAPVAAAPTAVAAQDDNALIADDADLIEKEWVTRAKAVVEQTKEDPYEQNKAINRVKAEYIKKRYNKDLKASEG